MYKMDYYDTGTINSKRLQDEFGRDRVGAIMDRLKRQLFLNFRKPHVPHKTFSAYDKLCLKAMEGIDLVRNEAKGYRLTQACDVTSLKPNSLTEQTKQKNDLECNELVRGTTAEERDYFQLGTGETFAESTSNHVSKITSSWWSCEDDSIGGYGDGTTATTYTKSLFSLSDVDVTHVRFHIQHVNIDTAYNWNQALFYAVYESVIDIEEAHIDEDEDFDDTDLYEEMLDDVVGKDAEYTTPNMMIYLVKKAAAERKIPIRKDIDLKPVKKLEAELHTAAGALKYIKELNVIYHPWVTIVEIQKYREYNPPVNSKQRTLDTWLRGGQYYKLKF